MVPFLTILFFPVPVAREPNPPTLPGGQGGVPPPANAAGAGGARQRGGGHPRAVRRPPQAF